MITLMPEVTRAGKIPRTLHVPFFLGRPCGEPFDFDTRRNVVRQLLDLSKLPVETMVVYESSATKSVLNGGVSVGS